VGHAESLGRPALLAVTDDFLRHFGLESVDQLPQVASS
jgi:chromosome segregation and condensation protein ScpB